MTTIQKIRRAWATAVPGLAIVLACLPTGVALVPTSVRAAAPAAVAEYAPAGPMQTAFIRYEFAVYYADAPAKPPLDALRAALRAVPGTSALVPKIDELPKTAQMMAIFSTQAQQEYAPPAPALIQRFGRGLSREQAVGLQGANQVLVLDFAHPRNGSMARYRSSLLVAERVARDTGGLLWDEETREIFTPDEWRKRRVDTWQGDLPDIRHQFIIHAYRSEHAARAISLGMAKFGLPDVVVVDFPWSANAQLAWVLTGLSQALIEGQPMGAQGRFDLDFRRLRHAALKRTLLEDVQPGSSATAPLLAVKGTPEEGDPENRLIELRFDRSPGRDAGTRMLAMLDGLFGASADPLIRVDHDEALLAASAAAKARLPELKAAFERGFQPGEYLSVKAPFSTPSGGQEWMWVEVSAWSGDRITGMLRNDPVDVPGLHAGQTVTVSQKNVFDYLRTRPGAPSEGNETGKILEKMR